jgi:hypothetical protein
MAITEDGQLHHAQLGLELILNHLSPLLARRVDGLPQDTRPVARSPLSQHIFSHNWAICASKTACTLRPCSSTFPPSTRSTLILGTPSLPSVPLCILHGAASASLKARWTLTVLDVVLWPRALPYRLFGSVCSRCQRTKFVCARVLASSLRSLQTATLASTHVATTCYSTSTVCTGASAPRRCLASPQGRSRVHGLPRMHGYTGSLLAIFGSAASPRLMPPCGACRQMHFHHASGVLLSSTSGCTKRLVG